MSLPRYPEYKDSGVAWLGEVPGHWEVSKLSAVALQSNAGEVIDKSYWSESGDILYTCPREALYSDYLGFPDQKRTKSNDILLTRNGTPYVHLPVEGAIYTNVVQRVTLNEKVNRIFVRYTLGEATNHLVGYGVSIESLNYELWKGLRFPLPPPIEQQTIAAFLDRETGKIDALIAEQRRLVELLAEKRQAVISHAVTKGLNPNAPMKDSGIEWLGEVPEHWVVVPLRWRAKCSSGDGIDTSLVNECGDGSIVPVIGGNGVMGYTVNGNIEHCVLAIGRVGALCGNVHIVQPPAWISDNALVLDIDTRTFDIPYLADVIKMRNLNDIASKTAQPLITGTQVKEQKLPCPPMNEQQAIAAFLDTEIAKFDILAAEANRAIELLQERRSALISAAVTGKMDVRSYSPALETA